MQPVDLAGVDLGLDDQLVVLRNDQHDRLAGRDHSTNGVDAELIDGAVLRGANLQLGKLVLGRNFPLGEFVELRIDLAQLLGDFGAHILVDLEYLELGPSDLGSDLAGVADHLAELAFKLRLLALRGREAIYGDQILLLELEEPGYLLVGKRHHPARGVFLCLETLELLAELGDLFLELIPLTLAGRQAKLERASLERHQLGHIGIAGARHELWRKDDGGSAFALGLETGSAGKTLVDALGDDAEIGCRRGVIEADENLPGLDLVPFLNVDLGDGAAFLVLDLLDRAVDDEPARGSDGTGEIDGRRHAPKPEDKEHRG